MRFERGGAAVLAVFALVVGACSVEDEGSSGDGGEGGSVGETADAIGDFTFSEGGEWDPSPVVETVDDLDCGQTADDPTRGVTDTTIKVGGLLTSSGPTAALFGDAELGARARFERANTEGGVHGRTIDFVGAEDDGLDPARQVDAARRLVSDEVFAVVPLLSSIQSFRDPLCDAVMPHFGWGISGAWCHTTVGFPVTGCLTTDEPRYTAASFGSILRSLLEGTDNTVAFVGNEDEAARTGISVLSGALEGAGLETVYAENLLSPTAPIADASPIVNDVLTSNDGGPPATIYLITDFANTSAMTEAFSAAGYEGVILNAVGYDPRLAEFAAFEGTYTTLQWMPFESTDVAFVQQMTDDLDQYAPNASRGLVTAAGYMAADMFLAGLDATGPDLTVDSFMATMNDDFTYSTPDFRGEAHFPANHSTSVPCGTVVAHEDQEYSAVAPLACSDVHPVE